MGGRAEGLTVATPALRAHRDLAQAEAYLCRTCGRLLGPSAVRHLHARSAGGPRHPGRPCMGSVTPGALLPIGVTSDTDTMPPAAA